MSYLLALVLVSVLALRALVLVLKELVVVLVMLQLVLTTTLLLSYLQLSAHTFTNGYLVDVLTDSLWKVFRIGTMAHVCACVTGLQHSALYRFGTFAQSKYRWSKVRTDSLHEVPICFH